MQKYIEKLKQNVFWGFYLSKQSEKANFDADIDENDKQKQTE